MEMSLAVQNVNSGKQKNNSNVSHQKVAVNLIPSVTEAVENARQSKKQSTAVNANLTVVNVHQEFVQAEIYNAKPLARDLESHDHVNRCQTLVN